MYNSGTLIGKWEEALIGKKKHSMSLSFTRVVVLVLFGDNLTLNEHSEIG